MRLIRNGQPRPARGRTARLICTLAMAIAVLGAGAASAGAAPMFTVPPAPIVVGATTLSNISLNGNGKNTITVAPGQDVKVSADWADNNSGCGGCIDFVSAAFAGAATPAGCIENHGMYGNTGSGTVDLGLAPTTPGLYNVDSGFLEAFSCDATGNTLIAQVYVASANLSILKTASPTPNVLHGQQLTFTLLTSNAGPDTAGNPQVVDVLPAGDTFVSASPDCIDSAGTVTCSPAPNGLAMSSSMTDTITVTAGTLGPQTNTATVSDATSGDPTPVDNTSSATVNVVPAADLSLTKTSSPNPAIAGQQVTYTLTAHNAGPDTAVAPSIVDTLPAGTTFQGASSGCTFNPAIGPAGTVTCPVGDIASGGNATRQIVVLSAAGSPVNNATVSSTTADPTTGPGSNNNATTTTTVAPSCTLTRSGAIRSSIIVHSGQFLCLVNANVSGAVIVDAGGALSVTNSTIGGSIGSDGAQFVTVCGSTVKGSTTIKNTTLQVRVGDDDSNCAPNHITGSLLLSGNQGGVEAFGNTIGGPVSATNNRGASPLADAAPEVEGNHITGALACSGNIPPVTNDGVMNTAGGAKTGECVGL